MRILWSTAYTRLWIRVNGIPRYSGDVAIEDIHFITSDEGKWTCSYCGSCNTALNCEHCNAPRKTRFRQGIATLRGYLPSAAFLTEIDTKFDIQVLRGECTDPQDYGSGNVIFMAQDCVIEDLCIESLTALSMDDVMTATLRVPITGTFSLHYEVREEIRWTGLSSTS